jgi:hypothetical protein
VNEGTKDEKETAESDGQKRGERGVNIRSQVVRYAYWAVYFRRLLPLFDLVSISLNNWRAVQRIYCDVAKAKS